jgi:hypothetical protein
MCSAITNHWSARGAQLNRQVTQMVTRGTAFLLAVALAVASGCSHQQWTEGGLYSVESEHGGYLIAKILKLDPEGVHMRLYSNQFPTRPSDVDPSKLYMVGINHKPNESLGMGHLPLSRASFESWKPVQIKVVPVKADELEGYEIWKESGGGYF